MNTTDTVPVEKLGEGRRKKKKDVPSLVRGYHKLHLVRFSYSQRRTLILSKFWEN